MSTNQPARTGKLTRRDFLKITAIAGLSLGLGSTLNRLSTQEKIAKVAETHYLMGTIVNLSVYSTDIQAGRLGIRKTIAEMQRLIRIFDHRSESSPVSILNRTGRLSQAPDELLDLIRQSQEFGSISEGAFDITVKPLVDAYRRGQPVRSELVELVDYRNIHLVGDTISFSQPGMGVTLDGIAKGRVVDGGVAVLHSLGYDNVLVEAGGDMLASRDGDESEPWMIGIRHPRNPDEVSAMLTFQIENKAAATSGDYEHRYASDHAAYHIIDPRVGRSPLELASATVIADTAVKADALSTTLMVAGMDTGLKLVGRLPGVEALLIDSQLRVFHTAGFPIRN